MAETPSAEVKRPDRVAQITAILGPGVRCRDLINVSHDEVVAYVMEHGSTTRRNDAAREIVRRQMRFDRTLLNHRYWHAHGRHRHLRPATLRERHPVTEA